MRTIDHQSPIRIGFRLQRMLGLVVAVLLAIQCVWECTTAAQSAGGSPPSVAVPAYRQANSVAVLTIRGVIDDTTLLSLERRMKDAQNAGADAVVLDIDTPGGEMKATLDICHLVRDRRVTPANIVAWVNPQAYSAGTIIALACREVVIAPGGTFGDAAPIQISAVGGLQQLPATERAKILAPLLTEISESARQNHYDEGLVHAFVRLSEGLWMLENTTTGERAFVGKDEYRALFGKDPPPTVAGQPIDPATAANAPPPRTSVRPSFDAGIPRIGDAAGLSPDQARQHEAFTQTLAPARTAFTSADRGEWRLVRQVIDNQSLLTLRSNEAMYYGLASAVIANDAELQNYFGAARITRYDESWSEKLVRFLISLPVRAVLIIIFLISLFVELATPGVGVFGTVATIALLVFVGAPALVGMAQWWEILLIIVGLALVFAELLLIPGTGIAGIAGVACLLVGLVSTFVSGDISTEQGQTQLWTGLATTLVSVFAAAVGMWLISRQLHSIPVLNRVILNETLPAGERDRHSAVGGVLAAMGVASGQSLRVGAIGRADTDLRPAGRAMIEGRAYDVQTAGGYIARGASVRVINVEGMTVEVEDVGE